MESSGELMQASSVNKLVDAADKAKGPLRELSAQ